MKVLLILSLVISSSFVSIAYAASVELQGKSSQGEACSVQFSSLNLASSSSDPIVLTRQPFDEDGYQYSLYHLQTSTQIPNGAGSALFRQDHNFDETSEYYVDSNSATGPQFHDYQTSNSVNGNKSIVRDDVTELEFSVDGKVVSYKETVYRTDRTEVACVSCDPLESGCDCQDGYTLISGQRYAEAIRDCAFNKNIN